MEGDMNIRDYELYLKEAKCEHGEKPMTVVCMDKKDHKYSAVYDCGFNCAKFYLYPDPSPLQSDEAYSVSEKKR
jgi:hypothetical protein